MRTEGDAEVVATVDNPIDAVGAFLSTQPTHVVVDGDLDGRNGLRMTSALANLRRVPTVLIVASADRDEVRDEAEARGLEHVRVASWVGREAPSLLVANGAGASSFHTVGPLLSRTFGAIVLLGSAGTPHMLPTMIPRLRRDGVPLVVGVHHNPRLSCSFAEWVGDLAGVPPSSLSGERLPSLAVARAELDVDALQPDLGAVLEHVLHRCDDLLVIVASGMQFEGVAALRVALERGATLVALHPDRCPQPGMVQCLLDAGLEPSMCTHDEIARLIRLATWSQAPALSRTG